VLFGIAAAAIAGLLARVGAGDARSTAGTIFVNPRGSREGRGAGAHGPIADHDTSGDITDAADGPGQFVRTPDNYRLDRGCVRLT
jgi:hypothetical protein